MLKQLLSRNITQRLREGQEVISRYFPSALRASPKHGLGPTQIYPHGRNFEKSLKQGTLATASGFSLPEGAKIVSIGTCFAEEISFFLKNGNLPLSYICMEPNRWDFSANWGRVYTVPNLQQIINYSFHKYPLRVETFDNKYFDPLREHSATSYESFDLAIEGIKKHRAASRHALETADLITLTLGQNEAWTDRNSDMVWGSKPHVNFIDLEPERFSVDEFTYEQNYTKLCQVIFDIIKHNPKAKILITVSPVPAHATFNGLNVISASFAAKCMLRTVAERVISENAKCCFYFPSFEMSLCMNDETFRADNRHIRRKRVDKIFRLLRETYFKG